MLRGWRPHPIAGAVRRFTKAKPMMSAFDQAFDELLGNEGGYVDNPADPGGATRWGITERVARANGYEGDMQVFPQDLARIIARKLYWNPYLLDQLDRRVAFQVFDAIYNSGPRAVEWLQEACGAHVDGQLGPITVAAAGRVAPAALIARFDARRLLFLANLDTWPSFGRGWARRIANNLLQGEA